jgi:hypothetical protein
MMTTQQKLDALMIRNLLARGEMVIFDVNDGDLTGVRVTLLFPLDGTAVLVREGDAKQRPIAQCADTDKLKAFAAKRGAEWASMF